MHGLVQQPVPVVVLGGGQLAPREVGLQLAEVIADNAGVKVLDLFLREKYNLVLMRLPK